MPSLLPGESDANPASTLIEQSTIVDALLGPLHTDTRANLTMWSECELIEWIDRAVKQLARKAGLFVGREIGAATVAGTAAYALPSQHISTIHVSYNSQPLRPVSTSELAALDSRWQTRQAASPKRWYQDTLGMAQYGLAPIPSGIAALWVIYHGWPQTVDCALAHTSIPLPLPLAAYLELEVLAEAYSKEGDGYAPDIASAARKLSGLYEQVAADYWGTVG